MPEEKKNIISQQEAEAERLGIKLDDEEETSDDSKESQEEEPGKKIEQEESESEDDKEDKEDSEEEDKSEDDAKDDSEAQRPPKSSLAKQASLQRENTRIGKIVEERLTQALNPITEMLKELKTAKTPEQKQEAAENIDEELAKIAETEKIPVDQFKKIAGLIQKQVEQSLAPRLQKVDEMSPLIEQSRQKELKLQSEQIFNQEWEKEAEPLLTEQYATATAKQMNEARKLLAELSVSPEYGDTRGNKDGLPEHPAYPVDYILYKEAEKIDSILRNPKKKSFESSSSISDDTSDKPSKLEDILSDDKEITNAADAIKRSKALDKATFNAGNRTIVRRGGQDVDVTE